MTAASLTFSFFLILAIQIVCRASLLCNGDFENFGLVPDTNGQKIQSVFSDSSCWYNMNGGFLIAKIVNLDSSTTVEFTTGFPSVLCQDVQVTPGNNYQLNFSILNQNQVLSSEMTVSINSVPIYNLETLGQLSLTNGSANFVAKSILAQICFEPNFSMNMSSSTMGPCIDNITLEDITAAFYINNNTNTSAMNSAANSTSNFSSYSRTENSDRF